MKDLLNLNEIELIESKEEGNKYKCILIKAGVTKSANGFGTYQGKTFDILLKPNEKILDGLLREKLNPPYSCSSGACATCIAKLVSGKVHMDVSMALDQSEIEAGYILTCQAKPLTAEVEINYDL